jgi:hypothetical protein
MDFASSRCKRDRVGGGVCVCVWGGGGRRERELTGAVNAYAWSRAPPGDTGFAWLVFLICGGCVDYGAERAGE